MATELFLDKTPPASAIITFWMKKQNHHYVQQKAAIAACELFIKEELSLPIKSCFLQSNFSLGGYSTVRGYNERIVNYDNAGCIIWS